MENPLLSSAYSPEEFRKQGHNLVDFLADHLEDKLNEKSAKAIHWHTPDVELEYWQEFLEKGSESQLMPEIIKRTTYVHHPKYIGHQVSPTAPLTALTGMISALLNNGMAVYEMGMAPSAIERVVTDWLAKKIGYNQDSRGLLTSGGTLANLTALLAARKSKVPHDVWNEGSTAPLGIMVSEEAHYCVDRAARIMGLGEKGILKIPCTTNFEINTDLLEERYKKATDQGIQIFAIVGSAPSTATGVYDDLEKLAAFAEAKNIWFHVDGAHGGAAIFSPKYKHTVKGIDKADSVVIDGHKMMMLPIITTALIFKKGSNALATFSQKADYLLTQTDHEDWYNSGKKTFECTKTMMSIHWYALLKYYGEGIFDEYVTTLFDRGGQFAELIAADDNFELAVWPNSNILCFRYVAGNLEQEKQNKQNEDIRQALLEDGEFYIVQTKLRGIHYLRCTIMNPFTTTQHLRHLLDKIKSIAPKLEQGRRN